MPLFGVRDCPRYVVDLDAPPSERWNEVIKDFADQLPGVVAMTEDILGSGCGRRGERQFPLAAVFLLAIGRPLWAVVVRGAWGDNRANAPREKNNFRCRCWHVRVFLRVFSRSKPNSQLAALRPVRFRRSWAEALTYLRPRQAPSRAYWVVRYPRAALICALFAHSRVCGGAAF